MTKFNDRRVGSSTFQKKFTPIIVTTEAFIQRRALAYKDVLQNHNPNRRHVWASAGLAYINVYIRCMSCRGEP